MEENVLNQNARINSIAQDADQAVKVAKGMKQDILNTNTYVVGLKNMVIIAFIFVVIKANYVIDDKHG